MKNSNGSPCNIMGMAFAMKTEITAEATNRQSAKLGVMTNALENVDLMLGTKLSKVSFDDACLQLFTQADRPGGVDTLCRGLCTVPSPCVVQPQDPALRPRCWHEPP